MVSILKNQLLKHLSRYTKNLSADKINLNTLKGEGELSNLQLDECVITDLLELPSWLRLTSAWCNHVAIKVSWTKLKSVPIILTLDSIDLTLETSELSRLSSLAPVSLSQTTGKYSFIHKIIDGITVIINSVNIKFLSPAFTSSFQMSRIKVESRTPKWQTSDLRYTRLKDSVNGQILVFKEISWQTMRIEASSTKDENLTPLRLLTNEARCRITIKKKLSDCSVVSCRLVVILDDLLWVLTDSQLKAALHFIDSLSELIKIATKHTQRAKAQKKLDTLPEHYNQQGQTANLEAFQQMSAVQRSFAAVDVRETSYHFFSQRIDLHLCDDPGDGRSVHQQLKDGGALQISLQEFQIDFYPYHLASASRTCWPKYKESAVPPAMWLNHSLNTFRQTMLNISQNKESSNHSPLERTQNYNSNRKQDSSASPNSLMQKQILENLSKLMTTCVVLRIENFTVYRVTTSGRKQMPKTLIGGDKERYSFPTDLSTIHAEFTYFYYPGDFVYPLPPSKMYVHINPIQAYFDIDSCLWLNSFMLSLYKSLTHTKDGPQINSPNNSNSNTMYMDVKMEVIMPRVIFESHIDSTTQRDRPNMMQVQISRLTITNTRELGSSRADLALAITSLQQGSLIFGSEFPSNQDDLYIVTEKMLSHIAANDITTIDMQPLASSTSNQTMQYALWTEPRDIWCVKLDPIWIEFLGVPSLGLNRPVTFVDAVPVTLWIHGKSDHSPSKTFDYYQNSDFDSKIEYNKTGDIHVIAHLSNLVSIQIDHYQVLFLLRLTEEIMELSAFLEIDTKRILREHNQDNSIIFGCVIPQVEVSLLMPSISPIRVQNFTEADSVPLDSVSNSDDLNQSRSKCGTSLTSNTKSDMLINSGISLATKIGQGSTSSHGQKASQKIQNLPKETSGTTRDEKDSSQYIPKEINSGITSMRKGISSFITSIDTAFKTSTDDDTLSIRSDYSSDSENILIIMGDDKTTDCIDLMFKLSPSANDTLRAVPIEEASEVFENEESISSPSGVSEGSLSKKEDLVSISTFRLVTVELFRQNKGLVSTTRIQVATVTCEECNAIPWDEFQIKFGIRDQAYGYAIHPTERSPSITLRLEETINIPSNVSSTDIDKQVIASWSNKKVTIKVRDLDLELSIGIVTGIVDLFDDEVPSTAFLTEIEIANLALHLTDNRPSLNVDRSNHASMDLKIGKLIVKRDKEGVFYVQPEMCNIGELSKEHQDFSKSNTDWKYQSLHNIMQQIMNENENLRLKISTITKANEYEMNQLKQEVELLKSLLNTAQNDLKGLLEGKHLASSSIPGSQTKDENKMQKMKESHR